MKKTLSVLLILAICLSLSAIAGCTDNGDELPVLTQLIVGFDDSLKPMGYHDPDTGELMGFDIDFANAVGGELEIKIIFQPINWDGSDLESMLAELNCKNVDCIWSGLEKTPQLEDAMILSKSYASVGEIDYVVGFRKEDAALCATVDKAIKALQKSGVAGELSAKWFGGDN